MLKMFFSMSFVIFIISTCFSSHLAVGVESKIALVSLQRALNEVEEGKRAKASIEADMNIKKKQLDSMKEELKKQRDKLEKEKMVLSKEALQTKTNEIQGKFLELQKKAMEYEQELKTKETESVSRILNALKNQVIQLAKKRGFDIVYENSAETVLYTSNAVDMTDDLIKTYNQSK